MCIRDSARRGRLAEGILMTADGASSSLRVDPLDCDPRIVALLAAFCHAMRVERNASVHTLRAYRIDLMDFARWACRERIDILAATHRQLRRYLGELDRAQYSRTTVNRRLSALRSFFRWLNVTGIADEDPASILQGPKQPKSLPHVIRASDMVKLLTVYGNRDAAGREREQSSVDARNLALLEFLYACGARVSEASGLLAANVDFGSGQVKVFGKGSKERIVPLHDMAVSSMRAYATWARPLILRDRTCDYFFGSTRGNRMGTDASRKMFKDALRQAVLDLSLIHIEMCIRDSRKTGPEARRNSALCVESPSFCACAQVFPCSTVPLTVYYPIVSLLDDMQLGFIEYIRRNGSWISFAPSNSSRSNRTSPSSTSATT